MILSDIGMFFSSSHWLVVAFIAPVFWSLVNIIDVYFVGGIYEDEYDGSIISSLFQMLPWPIIFLFSDLDFSSYININFSGSFHFEPALGLAFLGGIAFSLSFFFYFKSLFSENDVAMLQVFWNLTVILVPVLSFVFFDENLGCWKYLGMLIVFLGASFLSVNSQMRFKLSKEYMSVMAGAVFFLSLTMVLSGKAYSILEAGGEGFWIGFLFFSLGCFFWGILMSFWKKRNVWPLIKRHYKVFFLAETLSFLGTMSSQRAVDISPSVSYVEAIAATTGLFVILFSLVILGYLSLTGRKDDLFKKIYSEQVDLAWLKFISTIIMMVGIYIISS